MLSMFLSSILCLLWGAPAQDARAEALVRQLGSRVFAEREEAERALGVLGREALPALTAARESEDPEIRARATVLAAAIQQRILVEPTMVRLDFTDRPVAEVARAIGDQAGISIVLLPENQPMWQGRRITLLRDEPVPLWGALDALTDATQTQIQPAQPPNLAGPGGLNPSLRLLPGSAVVFPTSDSGPFRCTVVSIHHHQDLTFQRPTAVAPPGGPGTGERVLTPQVNDQFYLLMQLQAEPRLLINQSGSPRILEALDDRGRSLVPGDQNGGALRGNPYFGGGGPMSMVQLQVALMAPGGNKGKIRRLRGLIPVTVATLKPDPLAIPLAEAAGKTFTTDSAAVTIDAMKIGEGDQPKTIDLTLKTEMGAEGGEEDPFRIIGPRSMSALQVRFELVNAQGQPVRFLVGRSQTVDGQVVQMTLTIPQIAMNGVPTELRFRDIVTTSTEVEFNYEDLPLP